MKERLGSTTRNAYVRRAAWEQFGAMFKAIFAGVGYVTETHLERETRRSREELTRLRRGNEDNQRRTSGHIAVELEKFHELKEKGVITDEEFDKMKKSLLDKNCNGGSGS